MIPADTRRILLIAGAVCVQYLSALTLGRLFISPNLVTLALVYISSRPGRPMAYGGAFWAGIALDLLLYQRLGVSSLSLLLGLYVAGTFLGAVATKTGRAVVIASGIATLVSDALVVIFLARPLMSSYDLHTIGLLVLRILLTMLLGFAVLGLRTAIGLAGLRSRA